jgi:hypothetical protein
VKAAVKAALWRAFSWAELALAVTALAEDFLYR